MPQRSYPVITRPCPAPPTIDAQQRRVWCGHCRKHVHNLSAMTAEAQRELLAREVEPCVSYRYRVAKAVPVALVLLAAAGSLPAAEPEAPVDAGEEALISIVVGGASRITESLFESSNVPEPADREPTAPSGAGEPER